MTTQTELLREALEIYKRCGGSLDLMRSTSEDRRKIDMALRALAQPEQPAPQVPQAEQANEADELLRNLGLDPERYRTEAGFINHLKVKAAIRHPGEYPQLEQAEAAKPTGEVLGFMQQIKAAKENVVAWEPWMQAAAVTASTPVAPGAAKPETELHGKIHGHAAKATFPAWPETERAFNYARHLAEAMWARYFKERAPDWKACDDLLGVLTQIDNMVAGMRAADSKDAGESEQNKAVYVYRLMREEEGIWVPASEFFTGPPDQEWENAVRKNPERWKIQRRVTGKQIAEGLAAALSAPYVPPARPQAADAQPLTDELKTLRAFAAEYNEWIRFQAAGHDYDEFLRQKLKCTHCKPYKDATGELVLPLCRCRGITGKDNAS